MQKTARKSEHAGENAIRKTGSRSFWQTNMREKRESSSPREKVCETEYEQRNTMLVLRPRNGGQSVCLSLGARVSACAGLERKKEYLRPGTV